MHLHNARDYAPSGMTLERTDYEERGTVHRFLRGTDEIVECVVPPGSTRDDEAQLLAEFNAKHTPPPVVEHVAEHKRAYKRVSETAPALEAKHDEHIAARLTILETTAYEALQVDEPL